jgi:hypothetical protein
MSGKLKVGVGIAKAGYGAVRDVVKKILKPKSSPVISSVKPGTNLARKRKVQDNVVSDKDKAMKNLDAEGKVGVRTTVPLKKTNKEVSDILDKKK